MIITSIFLLNLLASVRTTASLVSIKNDNQHKSSIAGCSGSNQRDSMTIDHHQPSIGYSEGGNSRMRFSDVVSDYQRRRVSGPDSFSYFCTSEVNPSEKTTMPLKNNRYFKQQNMARQAKRYTPFNRKEERNDNEFQLMKASTSNSNLSRTEFFMNSSGIVTKSCSVPNFTVLFISFYLLFNE